ncbi:MAG: DNA translocase FtsK 4TM domain-containing protein, partial [Deltaproteobacteria bacterium]|nr:DNA translocase FtsK 4TM domain-containing protein [Deltaproteobacteria bacterium]
MTNNNSTTLPSYLKQEVPGLFCLFLAVIIGLALVSFDPADPSLFKHTTGTKSFPIHNYIGIIGAYLAALLIEMLGLASFWIVLVLGLLSALCFRGRWTDHPRLLVAGLILLLLSSAMFLGLAIPRLTSFWPRTAAGGLLGDVLGHVSTSALGLVGAWLVLVALSLLSI